MKKIIVTHLKPDLDAVASVWLIRRFWPEWSEAEVKFVPAGSNYQSQENEEVITVDTGGGQFDHHQASKGQVVTSATKLVWQATFKMRNFKETEKEALNKMVDVITQIDNFRELAWPEADSDKYTFLLSEIVDAWSGIYSQDYLRVATLAGLALDGVLLAFKSRVRAEKDIKNKGWQFKTPWGKGLAVETANGAVEHLGQKIGYSLVVRKDPQKGNLRIVGRWDRGVDLSQTYDILSRKEKQATWFLHNSKCMLLNGAGSNPKMKPSRLSLEEVVKIIVSQIKTGQTS